MSILITGFEPFDGRDKNNSLEVALRFGGKTGIDILKIPVSFDKAGPIIIKTLKEKDYNLIILLGEAALTMDHIRLERVAINFKDAIRPDNDGITPDEEEVIAGGPTAYITRFPLKRAVAFLKDQGLNVMISNTAGTYVCNSLYYQTLHHLSQHQSRSIVLFVHLPVDTGKVSLSEMELTIQSLINFFSTPKYSDNQQFI